MPANPFQTNNPIPSAKGPLSGEAHGDIDSFATITQNPNPDGLFPDGGPRQDTLLGQDRKAQPGVPAYQTSPNKPLGKL
jgi:hypothetical protein